MMSARVPLGRRNALAEPRRLLAAIGGVGLALMLILLLDGLWAGIESNITTYEDNVGADLYVAQPGARNFIGAVSQLPADTVDVVRADPDVEWAVPVRSFLSIVGVHDRKVPVNVIGYTPGDRSRSPRHAIRPSDTATTSGELLCATVPHSSIR